MHEIMQLDSDEFARDGVSYKSLDKGHEAKAWVQCPGEAGEEACNYHTSKLG